MMPADGGHPNACRGPPVTTRVGRVPVHSGEATMCDLCRRSFLRGAGALGAAAASGLFVSPLMAQQGGAARLPARGEFTIANAYVMTMDGALGDIADGAVHVKDGALRAAGHGPQG